MILDSSAVLAVLFRERECDNILKKLEAAAEVAIGAPTLVESAIVASARMGRDARGLVARFLQEGGVSVVAFTDEHYATAVEAWRQFGKGRHRAALNFGDCLAYAVAKHSGRPLLCCGDDFGKTDLALA